jgi:hypothetical protein
VFLRRLVAFPESQRILVIHMLAYLCVAVEYGVTGIMVATLLRDRFGASTWQTLMATSSVPIMSLMAIFWNEVYRRLHVGAYLLALWTVAVLPLGLIACFASAWPVLICVLIAAFGTGGIQSLYADILRNCYPPAARGRIFSVLKTIEQSVMMVTSFAVGTWLDARHDAYRYYFPITVAVVGVGFLLLHRITREPLFLERPRETSTQPILTSLGGAYRNMLAALRNDPGFRRYETAFGIYGLGWMICYSLLAFLVTDKLGLRYQHIALSTQSVLQFTTLVMLLPAGMLLDRIGPIRLCGWTFLMLIAYPLGLLFATHAGWLAAYTVIYGVGMASVNMCWTMGPVSLAKNPSQAPHYLAIHATLVAVRAVFGQLPAVAFYHWTGRLGPPFVAAAVLFGIGSILMFRLARWREAPVKPAAEPPVEIIAVQSD